MAPRGGAPGRRERFGYALAMREASAAFDLEDIDYSRIDTSAILEHGGLALVDDLRRSPCERWLEAQPGT